MIILGINAYHGDVSAVLLRDGELVTAVEEERFRRVKHWAGFTQEAIRACLEIAGGAMHGFGDFVSTSLAAGRGPKLDMLDRVYFPHSLGLLYLALTQYLGFLKYGDEYKVMGLAPYGEPAFTRELRRLVHLKPDGGFELELPYFRHWSEGVSMTWDGGEPVIGQVYTGKLEELLGPARKPEEPLEPRHEAIAASLQQVFEEAALHVLNALHDKTRRPRL